MFSDVVGRSSFSECKQRKRVDLEVERRQRRKTGMEEKREKGGVERGEIAWNEMC